MAKGGPKPRKNRRLIFCAVGPPLAGKLGKIGKMSNPDPERLKKEKNQQGYSSFRKNIF